MTLAALSLFVRDTLILLTLAAAVLVSLTCVYRSPLLVALSKIAICAVMLNGIGQPSPFRS